MPKEKALFEIVAGDKDPSTSKEIVYIVYQTTTFLVTIDSDSNLNWTTNDKYKAKDFAPDFGEIIGSCNMAAAMTDRIFSSMANRMAYKKMLGEVMGRVLDDGDSKSAKKILRVVDQRLNEHCRERVRMAYIAYAFSSVILLGLVTLFVVGFHKRLMFFDGDTSRYRIMLASFLGGVGAFITTFIRFKTYTGSVVAGLPIHRLDGFLRIFYGIVAGLLITLAIKGNVLIGFANGNTNSQPWLGYFLAMIGGASEILIPNLISQTEQNLRFKTKDDEDKEAEDAAAKEKAKAEAAAKEKAKAKAGETESTETETEATDEEGAESTAEEDAATETDTESVEEPATEDAPSGNEVHIKADLVLEPDTDDFTPGQSKDLK